MRNDNVGGRVTKRAGDNLFLLELLFETCKMNHVEAREEHHMLLVKFVIFEKNVIQSGLGKVAEIGFGRFLLAN